MGGDEFAVILPESSVNDADLLCKRLESPSPNRPVGQAGRLHLSAGVTELQAEDDAVSFFERADEALYRAKGAGKGTRRRGRRTRSRASGYAYGGTRNGNQLVSSTAPDRGRRSRVQRRLVQRRALPSLRPVS